MVKGGSGAFLYTCKLYRTLQQSSWISVIVPNGPKRAKITLGGWSDYARLATVGNAQKAAKLIAKAVQVTFADGVDLDFEHMTDFDTFAGDREFEVRGRGG